MPSMRESGYNGRMQQLNGFFERGCEQNSEATYVSLVEILGDESGGYATYLDIDGTRVHARNTDGIHLTRAGGGLVADFVMELIKEDFKFMELADENLTPVD